MSKKAKKQKKTSSSTTQPAITIPTPTPLSLLPPNHNLSRLILSAINPNFLNSTLLPLFNALHHKNPKPLYDFAAKLLHESNLKPYFKITPQLTIIASKLLQTITSQSNPNISSNWQKQFIIALLTHTHDFQKLTPQTPPIKPLPTLVLPRSILIQTLLNALNPTLSTITPEYSEIYNLKINTLFKNYPHLHQLINHTWNLHTRFTPNDILTTFPTYLMHETYPQNTWTILQPQTTKKIATEIKTAINNHTTLLNLRNKHPELQKDLEQIYHPTETLPHQLITQLQKTIDQDPPTDYETYLLQTLHDFLEFNEQSTVALTV